MMIQKRSSTEMLEVYTQVRTYHLTFIKAEDITDIGILADLRGNYK